jgi:hypothetical protein
MTAAGVEVGVAVDWQAASAAAIASKAAVDRMAWRTS